MGRKLYKINGRQVPIDERLFYTKLIAPGFLNILHGYEMTARINRGFQESIVQFERVVINTGSHCHRIKPIFIAELISVLAAPTDNLLSTIRSIAPQ